MKTFNTSAISTAIKKFETNTGLELIVAAGKRSDPYPGANWRGGLLVGLLLASLLMHLFSFEPRSLEVLVIGLIIVLSVTAIKFFELNRFFFLNSEIERETSEKAAQLFSHFQSKDLGHDASILLFFSFSERKIHLLVDSHLKNKLTQDDLNEIVSLLRLHFKTKHYEQGVEKAIMTLESRILEKVGKNPHPPQATVEDRIFWF